MGLHLNIAMGRPLTAGASLIGKNGEFIKPRNLPPEHVYDPEEVSLELEAQYVRFVDAMGKKPTHLDSYLMNTSTYHVQRLAELEVLVSTQTKELMKAYGVELIHYGQL